MFLSNVSFIIYQVGVPMPCMGRPACPPSPVSQPTFKFKRFGVQFQVQSFCCSFFFSVADFPLESTLSHHSPSLFPDKKIPALHFQSFRSDSQLQIQVWRLDIYIVDCFTFEFIAQIFFVIISQAYSPNQNLMGSFMRKMIEMCLRVEKCRNEAVAKSSSD